MQQHVHEDGENAKEVKRAGERSGESTYGAFESGANGRVGRREVEDVGVHVVGAGEVVATSRDVVEGNSEVRLGIRAGDTPQHDAVVGCRNEVTVGVAESARGSEVSSKRINVEFQGIGEVSGA